MKALDLIFAARPLLLVPIWSVYLVSLYFHHQLSGGSFGLANMLSLFCLTLLGAGACYLNAVYDADSDRINNKGHFTQRGILSEQSRMAGFIILSVIAVGLSIAVSTLFFLVCIQLLVLSYFYSAPPFRLKDRPVAGLLSNAYAIGFLGSVAVFPKMNVDNAGLLGWDNPFYFGAAVAGVYLLTTISDRTGDAAVGKQTLAVLAGPRVTIALSLIWLAIAAVAGWQSEYPPLFWIAVVSALTVAVAGTMSSDRIILFAAKFPILLLTLLAGWYYPVYLIFIVVLVIATRIYYARRMCLQYPSVA
jgi:4-hydroxybenzoate polyprenyltransferase